MTVEHFYICPFCFQEASIIVDPSVPHQEYIEDCEHCCNSIQFTIDVDGEHGVTGFEVEEVN
jgi:hypothetical protein